METTNLYSGQSLSADITPKGVVELKLDAKHSSANVLNQQLQDELIEIIDQLQSNKKARGVLLYSAKSTFVLGADVNEFPPIFKRSATEITDWLNKVHTLFLAIESLPFPTVCAINGMAMGGGVELALATDFRVADESAQLALPEVTLGICPGWGGTVRLSRLIGAEAALKSWMLTGKNNSASAALQQGAVDAVVATTDLLTRSRGILEEAISGQRSYLSQRTAKQRLSLNNSPTTEALSTLAFECVTGIDPHYPAAPAIVNLVTSAMTRDYLEALAMERSVFGQLASGSEAHSLVGLFLNGQQLKKKTKNYRQHAQPIHKAAVIGAGIMGGGIAYQSASKGVPIVMKDIAEDALTLGMKTTTGLLDRAIAKGRMDAQTKDQIIERIQTTLDYSPLTDVDYVIEAVVERLDVKQQVLAEAEQHVSETAVLASNTSTISISKLAEALQHPQRFCGMHFFNPVHAMPLVEVIRGSQTSEDTIATTVAYAAAIGKTPIVVGDCPGFLVNRTLFPYFNGFNRLLRDGVDFERIDRVMEQFGWPMGPAYLADVIGLDTMVHADKVMVEGFPSRMGHDQPTVVEMLFKQGALGQKNGEGFYRYSKDEQGNRTKTPSATVMKILDEQATDAIDIDDQTIIDRLMLPMCLEVALCLEEGIVETPAEADMALILGLGFPRFRGGPLRYIDHLGLTEFAWRVKANQQHGPLYQLTPKLQQRVSNQNPFFAA